MLIENKAPVAAGDVISVRLTTGEELVARLLDVTGTGASAVYKVTKPVLLQIHLDPATGGIRGVGFAPFMFGVPEDSSFEIRRDHVLVTPMKSREDITTKYLEATSSIHIPPKNGLVT